MDRQGAGKPSPATGHLVPSGAPIVATVGVWNMQHRSTLEESRALPETDLVATAAAGWCGQVSVKGAASNESGVLWSRMPTSGCGMFCAASQQASSSLRL